MKRRAFLRTLMLTAAGGTLSLPLLNILKPVRLQSASGVAGAAEAIRVYSVAKGDYITSEKVVKSAEEWRRLLSPEQYHVLREKGTERAFTGQYDKHYEAGTYQCAGCGLDLYASQDKFDSKTGWPSFTRPVAEENIATETDTSFFMVRNELLCARCDGHLGHVFDDGPPPTGMRHCINSLSLTFVADK